MEITLGKIVSYVVGIPLILISAVSLLLSEWAALPLLGGVIILPPVRRWLDARFEVEFSRGAAAGIGTISVIALLVIIILAGLSGGSTVPGSDVSNVTLSAEDSQPPNADYQLEVTWNSRGQSAVNPNPDSLTKYSANEGEKFLVIRVILSNTGDSQIELTPRLFRLESENIQYDYQPLFGSGNSLSGVTVAPGGTHSAWVAFSIPEDTTSGTLIVNQEAYFDSEVAVEFNHDETLPINMAD